MSESRLSAWQRAERIWEDLLAEVEDSIPADFVPLNEQQSGGERFRPVELEITIEQRGSASGQPLDEHDPELVNQFTIRIRPESPRSQRARERQWTQLCQMRDSIRARLETLRRGKEDWLQSTLRQLLGSGAAALQVADPPTGYDSGIRASEPPLPAVVRPFGLPAAQPKA